MRILILGLNFQPEITGIGKYTGEMAAYLSRKGHQVRVITAPPYYPYWKVQPGYHGWEYRRESWSGVAVYRCPLWVPRKPAAMKRIFHLLSFALSSLPVVLAQTIWGPQIILCIAPSLFSAPFALLAARLSGARTWLHVQDFELEAATRLGMLGSGNLLTRWAARAESRLLRAFDRVSTISNRMLARLEQMGVNPERACLYPNWVDINAIFPLPDGGKSARKDFGIPADKVIVLYAGNMGVKQGLEILVEAAWGLRKNSAIHFVLCGDGSARAKLERAAREMRNVQFLPLQPPEKLNQLLNVADIHVLPQRADAADLVMPSKLLGMLASGKVVIATASTGTEIGNVVSQVGVLVPPEVQPALCEAILELGISPQARTSLGMKGRAFVCKNWSMEHILGEVEHHLRELQSVA
jgi:colanic acid biosynthesis glycosyl transferase WcaI